MTDCIRRPLTRYTTCRCAKCTPVVRRIYKLARAGRLTRVSSEAAWERLDAWIADGYTPAWISSAVGLSQRSIESAITERSTLGHVRTFGPERAAIIVSGDISKGSAGSCSARGARRRLQALACEGWTVEALGDVAGVSFVTLAAIQRGATERVTARRHHTVAALYERLTDTPGTSARVARASLAKGWEPRAAWDDPDTDPELADIDLGVDEVRIQRVLDGIRTDCTPAEQIAVMDAWRGSLNELARVTGWNVWRINNARKVA